MAEPILVDVREAYRRAGDRSLAVHIPLGILLGEPERLPHDRPVLVLGNDARESEFAARFLREHGRDAHAVRGDEADF